jgi:hypothetical protein
VRGIRIWHIWNCDTFCENGFFFLKLEFELAFFEIWSFRPKDVLGSKSDILLGITKGALVPVGGIKVVETSIFGYVVAPPAKKRIM